MVIAAYQSRKIEKKDEKSIYTCYNFLCSKDYFNVKFTIGCYKY